MFIGICDSGLRVFHIWKKTYSDVCTPPKRKEVQLIRKTKLISLLEQSLAFLFLTLPQKHPILTGPALTSASEKTLGMNLKSNIERLTVQPDGNFLGKPNSFCKVFHHNFSSRLWILCFPLGRYSSKEKSFLLIPASVHSLVQLSTTWMRWDGYFVST